MAQKVFSEVASSFKAQVFQANRSQLNANVFQSTASNLRVQVINSAASNNVVKIGDRTTISSSASTVSSSTGTFTNVKSQNILNLSQFSFTVRNISTGAFTAVVNLQLSADGTNYYTDPSTATQSLAQSGIYTFMPGRFIKYSRIAFRAGTAGQATTTKVQVFAQGQV